MIEKTMLFSQRDLDRSPFKNQPSGTKRVSMTWNSKERKMVVSYPDEKWFEFLIRMRKELLAKELR
jgi:hypothetical protein